MAPKNKCKFNLEWMKTYNWIRAVPNNEFSACCLLCNSNIDISSMGVSSLKSHAKSVKHQARIPSSKQQTIISNDLPNVEKCSSSSSATGAAASSSSRDKFAPASSFELKQVKLQCNNKDEAVRAEILWLFKVVSSHFSIRSCDDTSLLFQNMFPDSEIAKVFSLSRTKAAYVLNFGLSPYIFHTLECEIANSHHFSVSFDESINDGNQTKQMDLIIRYWSQEKNEVCDRYFDSCFLGKATADIIVHNLITKLNSLPNTGLIQLSFDGPNVNWSVYNKLSSELQCSLLNIGSCNLHVIDRAFRESLQKSELGVDRILSSVYKFFKMLQLEEKCLQWLQV